jgi:glycosyltransferase involved in cell wall biosynthesis
MVSLVSTVKNEADNIDSFFESILKQDLFPDEIIITEAGSSDDTYKKLLNWSEKISTLKVVQIGLKNRSIGRNIAIDMAKNDIIALTDFGCTLLPGWLREITKPFENPEEEVVSGFYVNNSKDILAKAISYFTHPLIEEIDKEYFLPSGRSMAFRKYCWKGIGGFPE